MKSKIIDIGFKVALTVAVFILYLLHFQSEASVVYVDAQKLMVGYKGMALARKEFESKAGIWKANLDTLRAEAETKMKEYEARKGTLTVREKSLMEELIQSKQEQFENYQQVVQEKAQKEDQEIVKRVLEKVNSYIKTYGKRKGYRIILAATQYGNIAYAKDGIDITEEVLEGLNQEYH